MKRDRGEKGDTLIEVLLAVVVLGLASVALIIAFGTSISASADHRNLTTVRTLLASASQQAIGEMQQSAQQALFASCNAGPGTVGSPYTTGSTAVTFSVPPSYSSLYTVGFVAASGSLNPVEWWNATSASFQPTCPAGYLNGPQLFTIAVTQTSTGDTYYNSFTVTLPQDSTKSLVAGTGCQATNLQFVTQPGPSPTPANTPLGQFTVAVNCANGAPLANDDSQVVLTLSGGAGASLSCNPSSEINGYVYFTGCAVNTAGTYTIAASDPSDTQIDPTFTGATSNSFTIGAAGLKLVFQTPPQAGVSGAPFSQSPVVWVENASNVIQPTWTGTITVTSSGGTTTDPTLNCSGTLNSYTGTATLGIFTLPSSCTFSGGYRYNAASQQSEPTSYTLTATGTPSGLSLPVTPGTSGLFSVTSFGAAKQLVFSTEPIGANGAANAVFTTQPAVTIEDAFGNVVSNSTASVTLTPNSGTLQCNNNTVSAVKGLATFAGCNEIAYGNNLTLSAASSGLTSATSTPFNITPIPNLLVFSTQPEAGASGSTLAVEPVVDVYYSTNGLPSGTLSLVTSELPQITLTPSTGGLLTTCSGLAPNAGIVDISTCAFAGIVGNNYTLTASLVTSAGTITVVSNTISPTVAGIATNLQFTTEPSPTVISGTTFAAGPVVTIYDSGGNVVTASTALVDLTSSSGGSLPSQCASLQAVSGVVDGTSCAFTGPNSNNAPYTLTASSQGLTNATSSSFISLTPPLAPVTPGASVTNATSVALTWTAPANGGVAISGYQVNDTNITTSAVGTNICPSAQTSTSLACTITGLTTTDTYTFTVAAINSIGTGAFSPATTAVSLVAPGAPPAAPTVTVPSATSVALTWSAPSDNGPAITGYQVNDTNTTTSTVGTNVCPSSLTSTGTTCTITGLITGDSYTFTVAAINVVGTGTYSPVSSPISLLKPLAPSGVSGTSNANTQSVVSWTAPVANGGPAITGYTVTSTPGGFTCTTTVALTCTVVGLTNGTSYTFTVTATNAVGTGPASSASA
ncbi:MAG: fibronectin type III domain-containing protein, partial [Acidimicrobiales bacterium]